MDARAASKEAACLFTTEFGRSTPKGLAYAARSPMEYAREEGQSMAISSVNQYAGAYAAGGAGRANPLGSSCGVNVAIAPEFLEKMANDPELEAEYKMNISAMQKCDEDFARMQKARGRRVVAHGWMIDKDGGISSFTITEKVDKKSTLKAMSEKAENIREAARAAKQERQAMLEGDAKRLLTAQGRSVQEVAAKLLGLDAAQARSDLPAEAPDGVALELSEEGQKAMEDAAKPDKTGAAEGESVKTSLGVNVGKLARMIAAAKTKGQLQAAILRLNSELQQVQNGKASGACGEAEVNQVRALLTTAQGRMGEVADREATPEEELAFAMTSFL